RGKKGRTTGSRENVAAGDRVKRQVGGEHPDQPWGGGFFYVSTKQGVGYVGVIIFVVAGYLSLLYISQPPRPLFISY
ncbi:IS3 family transposase, partial [Escherichia coli]|nr:IS3 family transposase [Escherichia coli]